MAAPSLPSEEDAAGNPEPKQRGAGRGLDEDKRTKIIALVANGSSRRVAAKIVPAQTYSPEQVQQMFLRVLPVLGIDVSDHACGQAVDLLHTLLAVAVPQSPAIGQEG
jgi:hypothetical protein